MVLAHEEGTVASGPGAPNACDAWSSWSFSIGLTADGRFVARIARIVPKYVVGVTVWTCSWRTEGKL